MSDGRGRRLSGGGRKEERTGGCETMGKTVMGGGGGWEGMLVGGRLERSKGESGVHGGEATCGGGAEEGGGLVDEAVGGSRKRGQGGDCGGGTGEDGLGGAQE